MDLYSWCLKNGDFGRLLLDEWTGLDQNGTQIDIHSVSKASHVKMRWRCSSCGKTWVVDVHNRTGYHTRCRSCSARARAHEMSKKRIATLKNDLGSWCTAHSEYGELLEKEWVGLTEDREPISIYSIEKGSSKSVFWKCSVCGTEWKSSPSRRTGKHKSGCPNCNTRSTSYPEQYLYNALKIVFPDAISRGHYMGLEYDIILPSRELYIEYSPTYTHKEKAQRDKLKETVCVNNSKRFLLIVEDSFKTLETTYSSSYICFRLNEVKKDELLRELVEFILNNEGISAKIDYEYVSEIAFMRSHGVIPYTSSVAYLFPRLCEEWHTDKNGMIHPKNCYPYSPHKVFWVCPKCGYGKDGEWKSSISNRSSLKQGCPICGYNWSDQRVHPSSSSAVMAGYNDLATQFPCILPEWNTQKNESLSPKKVRAHYHKKVFWLCEKCGYGKDGEWYSSVDSRIANHSGCPACGFNCFDGQYHMTSGTSAVKVGRTDFASQYPDLAKEWSPLNATSPSQYKSKSKYTAMWLCPSCGYGDAGEWAAKIGDRVISETGCPACGYFWKSKRGVRTERLLLSKELMI